MRQPAYHPDMLRTDSAAGGLFADNDAFRPSPGPADGESARHPPALKPEC